jgi:alpha 1,3-glucosidase
MGLGSEIRDPEKTYSESRIPDPEVKKAPEPGSRIRIRNTAIMNRISGNTPLPPEFAIAYHQCRWNYNDQEDVNQVFCTYRIVSLSFYR